MVDSRTEERIKDIVRLYLEKMDRSEFVMQGVAYFKQIAESLEPKVASPDDPDMYTKLSELYIWIKMLLISEDISEDILNSQIDRLFEAISQQ